MKYRRQIALALGVIPAAVSPAALSAQSLSGVAATIPREDPEYEPIPVSLGPIEVSIEGDARIEYDDNIFALPDSEVDDVVFVLSTQSALEYRTDNVTASLASKLSIRRFADQSSQNTEAAGFEAGVSWSLNEKETLNLVASWERAIEDRGDPEARRSTALGPREIDISSITASYRRARGKVLLDVEAEATQFDARSPLDDDRDFDVYGGTAKLGLRVSGPLFATASVFGSKRDFRLAVSPQGINRDATTYGGRVGVDIAPGGLIEGSAAVGVFRNEPDDPTIAPRTGVSLQALVNYRPSRRTSLIFEASRGDVATFRGGASGRTDSKEIVRWEQEIRHNLYSSASLGFRKSEFADSGIDETTVIARGEVEFVVSRNLSLTAEASFGSRNSDLAFEEFDRLRVGLGVRLRF